MKYFILPLIFVFCFGFIYCSEETEFASPLKYLESSNVDQTLSFIARDEAMIKSALDRHNELRKLHQVQPLTENPNISAIAQAYAEKLASTGAFQHSDNKYNGRSLGENLAMMGGMPLTGKSATQMWYDEIQQYDFNNKQANIDNFYEIGHFTQLVWKNSKEVGFGLASKGNLYYFVANYYPAGNMNLDFINNVFPMKSVSFLAEDANIGK